MDWKSIIGFPALYIFETMQLNNKTIYPILLLVTGIISLLNFNIIGTAALEGAAWKENAILSLLIIFCMLPSFIRDKKPIWLIIGYGIAFFMFGGANFYGTISMALSVSKFLFLFLVIWETYQLFQMYWKSKKIVLLLPLVTFVFVILLFPIKDENIVESAIRSISEWSTDRFSSDNGYHVYLGLIGIVSSVSEFFILKKQFNKDINKEMVIEVD